MDRAAAYAFVKERLGVDVQSADAGGALESLGVDSLALLELMFEIEEKFGVKIDEDTPPPRICGDVVALIEHLAAAKP
jgi:acyl carrier protein